MEVTRREMIGTLVGATTLAAVAPTLRAVGAPTPGSGRGSYTNRCPEEEMLWRTAAEALGEDAAEVLRRVEGGPTHLALRQRLHEALDDGRWTMLQPLVTECVRTAVPVARLIAGARPIDEAALAQTVSILDDHHGIVRTRMVLGARAMRRARTRRGEVA